LFKDYLIEKILKSHFGRYRRTAGDWHDHAGSI